MAYIKEKTRESLIKKINKSYGFRKFIISVEIISLIGFIIVTFLCWRGTINKPWFEGEKLTKMGIGMLVWACLMALFGLIALILTFTIKSPKTVKSEMSTLQSSALSGKKIKKGDTAPSINRDRTTSKKDKHK